jgi:hypothetical protein
MPPNDGAVPISDELRALDPSRSPPLAGDNGIGGDAGLGLVPPSGALSREDAARLARLGVDWILDAACKQYPVLAYPEPMRERAAQLTGAVLAKYDVMSWAASWREEFALGAFLAGLAWESYKIVQAAKGAAAAGVMDQAPAASAPSQPAAS